MLGPALTDMFPVEGAWDADKLTLLARPRAGRTTAFATCELTGAHERMTGTIDTNKGKIEFVRRKREGR
jgi:predicted nucleic acid binding AN1-type Zn finger protein